MPHAPLMKPFQDNSLKSFCMEWVVSAGPACWLWDYLRRSGASGYMLPLSGGADSSATAAIVGCMCQLITKAIDAGDTLVEADAKRYKPLVQPPLYAPPVCPPPYTPPDVPPDAPLYTPLSPPLYRPPCASSLHIPPVCPPHISPLMSSLMSPCILPVYLPYIGPVLAPIHSPCINPVSPLCISPLSVPSVSAP